MNNKLISIRHRRGGWVQVRTRYCAVYVRLGDRGPVWGDYETGAESTAPLTADSPRCPACVAIVQRTPPRRMLGINNKQRP